jgi:hypothetical protein
VPFHGGPNWCGAGHAVRIVERTGQIIVRLVARHDVSGPSGLIGVVLVEAGHRVRINLDVLMCRPHKCAAGARSHPAVTFLLAEVLRTDSLRFRALRPASEHDNPIVLASSGCLPTCDGTGQLCENGRIVCLARAQRLRVAQFLAEPGDIRERFPTDDQLAAEASV